MALILFKAKFRDSLLDGSKTTTIRSWKRRLVQPDTIAKTNLGIPLYILNVRQITLGELTDAHAKADGFINRDSLIAELHAIYAALPETLTLVEFVLAPTNSNP